MWVYFRCFPYAEDFLKRSRKSSAFFYLKIQQRFLDRNSRGIDTNCMSYPYCLLKLIEVFKKLPGVGTKSAERFAFHMLKWEEKERSEISSAILNIKKLEQCPDCGCLMEKDPCFFCDMDRRDSRSICVIAFPKDVFSIEGTKEFQGMYHVLGGVLSPLEGRYPDHLRIDRLKERLSRLQTEEVIIALDSTLEGDATALFLKKELESSSIRVSRLAFGLPMGSSLEYVDGGTLARALSGRQSL